MGPNWRNKKRYDIPGQEEFDALVAPHILALVEAREKKDVRIEKQNLKFLMERYEVRMEQLLGMMGVSERQADFNFKLLELVDRLEKEKDEKEEPES